MTAVLDWLRAACSTYAIEPVAIYRSGTNPVWPLKARNEQELREKLAAGGHFLALPKEPASLANVVEVSIVDFLLKKLGSTAGAIAQRGTERGYPDIEISGAAFGGGHHAIDIKVARRARSGRQTDSRITLYTGNTYFRYPQLKWPGTFRAFDEYESHLDVIALYTLNERSHSRIEDLELIVTEAWQVASKQRSSTTREYIGAVQNIDALRQGHGEFESKDDFYRFWRRYNFKIGKVVQQQLDKILRETRIDPESRR